jgi:hypothetical protein
MLRPYFLTLLKAGKDGGVKDVAVVTYAVKSSGGYTPRWKLDGSVWHV